MSAAVARRPASDREFGTAPGSGPRRLFAGLTRPSAGVDFPIDPSLHFVRTRSGSFHMRTSSGFTLIEVMITVAIVAILAAIAVPSYTEYLQRARITEATSALADMRNKMEQYFQDNRSWTPGGGAIQPCNPATVAPLPTSQNFTFVCDQLAANTYRVVATGNAASSMAGFQYSINQFNQRVTIALPPTWVVRPNCWVLRKDGSC